MMVKLTHSMQSVVSQIDFAISKLSIKYIARLIKVVLNTFCFTRKCLHYLLCNTKAVSNIKHKFSLVANGQIVKNNSNLREMWKQLACFC